jgi:hypothetical protein
VSKRRWSATLAAAFVVAATAGCTGPKWHSEPLEPPLPPKATVAVDPRQRVDPGTTCTQQRGFNEEEQEVCREFLGFTDVSNGGKFSGIVPSRIDWYTNVARYGGFQVNGQFADQAKLIAAAKKPGATDADRAAADDVNSLSGIDNQFQLRYAHTGAPNQTNGEAKSPYRLVWKTYQLNDKWQKVAKQGDAAAKGVEVDGRITDLTSITPLSNGKYKIIVSQVWHVLDCTGGTSMSGDIRNCYGAVNIYGDDKARSTTYVVKNVSDHGVQRWQVQTMDPPPNR